MSRVLIPRNLSTNCFPACLFLSMLCYIHTASGLGSVAQQLWFHKSISVRCRTLQQHASRGKHPRKTPPLLDQPHLVFSKGMADAKLGTGMNVLHEGGGSIVPDLLRHTHLSTYKARGSRTGARAITSAPGYGVCQLI